MARKALPAAMTEPSLKNRNAMYRPVERHVPAKAAPDADAMTVVL
jgi:hypothetical protein